MSDQPKSAHRAHILTSVEAVAEGVSQKDLEEHMDRVLKIIAEGIKSTQRHAWAQNVFVKARGHAINLKIDVEINPRNIWN